MITKQIIISNEVRSTLLGLSGIRTLEVYYKKDMLR